MASYILKVLDSSLAVTRTVTDTTATERTASSLRVAVDGSGNARLLAYTRHNPMFGSTYSTTAYQYYPAIHVYSCTTAASTFTLEGYITNCKEASQPWYNSTTGRFYVSLVTTRRGTGLNNVSTSNAGVHTVVVDITESPNDNPSRFRVAGILGEYIPDASYLHSDDEYGYFGYNTAPAPRPAQSGYVTAIGYGQINTYNARNYYVGLCRTYDPSHTSIHKDMFSGGFVGRYDGLCPAPVGFVEQPAMYVLDIGGGSLANGTYAYTAVFVYRDREGRVHYSRCAEPVSVTTTGAVGRPRINIIAPSLGNHNQLISTLIFRTAVGGTQYYLLTAIGGGTYGTSTEIVPTTTLMSYTDTTTDAVLTARALLFRQPGTDGTALDRSSALSGRHVIRHKDRVFYAHESNIYYSSFDVDGEAPWFNPGFGFEVIGGTGPITGLASLDGVLVVFKRDSVFLVDGDGPPENGGSGNEFTPPRRLHTPYGCLDQRSIVEIPDGIAYMSHKGIMLLTRGYKVMFLGERIEATTQAYKYVGGATFDRTTGRMYMVLSNTLTSDSGHDHTAAGVTVVFDTANNVWTKFFHTNTNGYGKAMQDVVYANAPGAGQSTPDCIFFADHNNGLFYEDEDSGLDASGSFVPFTLATGWVRAGSKQERIKVSDFLFLGRRLSGHNLKCSYYSDWNRSTATTIKTFDATATNITPEQLEFQPSKESCQSMKFVLQSETPSNPATLSTGQQVEINGITVRVGLRNGGAKLASTAKG